MGRACRDGHRETWWALEVEAGPDGPARGQRAVVATTDPATLADRSTWYLATNLPAPSRLHGAGSWPPRGRPAGWRGRAPAADSPGEHGGRRPPA